MTENVLTAAQLMAQLESDPAWVEAWKEKAMAIAAEEERSRQEQQSLVADLRNVGLEMDSVWDLVNTADEYAAAVPVLMEHIRRAYSPKVLEGILRALAVPEAHPYWADLVRLYTGMDGGVPEDLRYVLASVLGACAGDAHREELLAMARDPRGGLDRLPLLLGFRFTTTGKELLKEFEQDPVIGREVRRMRRQGAGFR